MAQKYRTTTKFDRQLRRKKRRSPRLALAVREAMLRLVDHPRHPSLKAHPIRGSAGVWEAYVTKASRLTFERDGDAIVFCNNCRHDIIDDGHW